MAASAKKTTKKVARKKRKPNLLERAARIIALTGACVFLSTIAVVLALRFVNPPLNYYQAREWIRVGELKRDWVPISAMPRYVPQSAIAAEDAKFCEHYGFDIDAIRAALRDDGRLRGGSTISQQTAKNVFLWQDRSWVRKGFEAIFTGLIEVLWGKQRIIEVYLNVAEFDEGVFGVGAAAPHYFGVTAANLSPTQAARLMAILPNPKNRSASKPSAFTKRRTGQIAGGAKTIANQGRDQCV